MERKTLTKDQKAPARDSHVHRKAAASHDSRLLGLQRSIGNHAVQRLIQSPYIQTKLQVSTPGDPLEQEADRTADTVMRMAESGVSRDAAAHITPLVQRESEKPEDEETMVSPKSHGVPLAVREDDDEEEKVQRACNDCEEETVNRKETDDEEEVISRAAVAPHAPAPASANIRAMQGGGSPLPPATRAFFEPRFGADFSHVRVHTDQRAAATAKSLNARAFTVGRDIAFGAGQSSFESHEGRRLLAHELTHVIQQNRATPGCPHAARQGQIIQRQTGTDYGLAGASSQNKYVDEAVRLWTTNKTMKVEDFVNTLMKAIETDLLSQGVPELKWQMSRGLGVSGSFDSENWIVNIDPDAFSSRQVTITELKDLNVNEVADVVGTLYHESRHTDQDVLIIRVLLDQKKGVQDIVQETKIPMRIVEAVKKTKFKTPPDAPQVAHAMRMFAVMYGEHKELLSFMMKDSQAVGGVQELVNASDANALKNAAPHVQKLAEWKKNVLEPKLKKLQAGKKGGPLEAQLTRDLGALNQVTANLLAAFATAVKMKNPTAAGLNGLQQRADEWQRKLFTAYSNLEGEKDALVVEGSVKKAFKKRATAKPTPAPTKKK